MPIKYGTTGNDNPLRGSSGNDSLYGLAGDDFILTEDGEDYVEAGDGDDEVNGYDGTGGAYTYYPVIGVKTIHGGNGNDFIVGGSDGDALYGDEGNDQLYGRNGNDILSGGLGADYMNGGPGNDTYYVSDIHDVVEDASGIDTAYVSASFVKIPSSIEKVSYTDGALALPYWVDALLPDEAAGNAFETLLGSAHTYFYTFPTSLPTYDTNASHGVGFKAFSAVQIARAEAALSYVSSVIDLHFQKTNNPGVLNTFVFANNDQTASAGFGNFPSEFMVGSDLYFDRYSENASFADGSYGALTLIHEIGHGLGLEHPFSHAQAGSSSVSDPPYLTGSEESTAWTVMSYNDSPDQYALNFSPLDIAALQYIYGPSKTSRTGNDTYKLSAATPNFIWDGAGLDTLDGSGLNQGATLYLTPGYWGYVGSAKAANVTAAGQVTVNFGSAIENLTGTSFADKLYGNELGNVLSGGMGNDWLEGWAGDDVMVGGQGDDQLLGGLGIDTVQYSGAYASYNFSNTANTFSVKDKRSNADGIDVLTSVERLKFSDKSVAIDVDGNAGIVVKVISAVLGSDAIKLSNIVGIGLRYVDNGMSYADLGLTALNAVGALTPDAIVSTLWRNVVGFPPSANDKAPYLKMLAEGTKPGDLVALAGDFSLNLNKIGLVGLAQTGIEFS
jgi:serralysin